MEANPQVEVSVQLEVRVRVGVDEGFSQADLEAWVAAHPSLVQDSVRRVYERSHHLLPEEVEMVDDRTGGSVWLDEVLGVEAV